MFRSIETTEVVFTKRAKVKSGRNVGAIKREDTPRPTEEDILRVLTEELDLMTTTKPAPITKLRSRSI